jgi:hypothetical protein
MEQIEKKLLDTITLSTIVIALGTFGLMMIEYLNAFDRFLIPMWAHRGILVAIALTSLVFTVLTLLHYFKPARILAKRIK